MDIKERQSVHNRFLIEVRDAETNELKQVGKAENIVLDNWGIDFNINSIYFGSGTDHAQQNPGMTKLIENIGSKSLSLVSTKWQNDVFVMNYKAQQIGTEEYNGKTIAEVGIYSNASQNIGLISHAFITDSEGNPLTITKTNKDVITLYATVYMKMAYEKYRVNDFFSSHFFKSSNMVAYLFQGDSKSLNRIIEVNEKRRKKGCWQLSNEHLNGQEIRGICFSSEPSYVQRVMTFPCVGLYEGTNISKGKLVGEKNGVNTQFDLPWDCVRTLKIYKNSQLLAEDQYTVNSNVKKSDNVLKDAKTIQTDGTFDETSIEKITSTSGFQYSIPYRSLFDSLVMSIKGTNFYIGTVKNLSEYTVELHKPTTVTHYRCLYYNSGVDPQKRYKKIKIDVYTDGQWREVYSGNVKHDNSKVKLNQAITNVSKIRVKLTEPNSEQEWKQLPYISMFNENDIHHITFNDPPLSTDVLEYDGFVDYIPKDEDHIVKFNFDMTLTPGAGE